MGTVTINQLAQGSRVEVRFEQAVKPHHRHAARLDNLFIHQQALDPARYRHARALIDQDVLDLDELDPSIEPGELGTAQILAHLALAAMDRLAEEITTTGRPIDWKQVAQVLGVSVRQAQDFCVAHTDDD